jgi:hypothetical protein
MAEATRQRHLHNSADFTPHQLSPTLWKDGGWMGVGWVESGTEKSREGKWTLKKVKKNDWLLKKLVKALRQGDPLRKTINEIIFLKN